MALARNGLSNVGGVGVGVAVMGERCFVLQVRQDGQPLASRLVDMSGWDVIQGGPIQGL